MRFGIQAVSRGASQAVRRIPIGQRRYERTGDRGHRIGFCTQGIEVTGLGSVHKAVCSVVDPDLQDLVYF